MTEAPWYAHYDAGVPRRIDYQKRTPPQMLRDSAKEFAQRPALNFLNCTLSYSELEEQVARFAGALSELGIRRGSRVAIQLPNMPQAVISFFAALSLGAEVVMTNPLYTLREIEHQWKDAGIELAIVADFLWDQTLRKNRSKLAPKSFVIASIPEYLRFPLNLLAPLKLKRQDPPRYAKVALEAGVHSFKQLVSRAKPHREPIPVGFDDIAVLQYTGGTTGLSKGAMLTHGNLSCNVQQIAAWFTGCERGHEVLLTALPLFHVFGLTVCMSWGIFAGSKLVLIPNPRDTKSLVKAVSKQRVTLFPAVPALFNSLNNYPGIELIDVSSVKACFSGSAPLPVDVLEKFEKLTGSVICEGFGMSETSPVATVNPLGGGRRLGSVGLPVSDTELRIVDAEDDSRVMPMGEPGELLVRGPQVMKGYWNRPEESAQALHGGWMHTGDLAIMDADGFFKIVGRKKDMINVSGMKVFPDEVDNLLMSHDRILEAATIGVPDDKVGETVKSFVVVQPGQALSAEEVLAFCRENLADYKVPRYVEFLDELPKSSVLKVLRRELRDRE